MSAMNSKPCYKCEKRHFLCHTDCEEYKRVRAERDAANARRYKDAEADALIKSGYERRKQRIRLNFR